MSQETISHLTFSKDELRSISKNFSSVIPRDEIEISETILRNLDLLLQRLLHTAGQPILSDPHRAAACNTLCGFLGQGICSSSIAVQQCCSSVTIWDRLFTIYLERSDSSRPKPMRQILVTLVKLLNHCAPIDEDGKLYNDNQVLVFTKKVISTCLALISLKGDVSRAKPAMQILDMFLSKKIIGISLLLDEFHFRSCDHDMTSRLGSSGKPNRSSTLSSTKEPFLECVESVVRQILQWIEYPDTGPAIGRLLKAFFLSFQGLDSLLRSTHPSISELPLWAEPIRQILVEKPDLMEVIGYYVLPDLFRIDPSVSASFVESLPLTDLQQGRIDNLKEDDIRLCLLVVQTMQDSKSYEFLPQALLGTWHSYGGSSLQGICSALIVHKAPNIRIAALSALLYSASSTMPIYPDFLEMLSYVIPFFHAEADPKTRGDVISTVRRLFSRLRNVILHLSKKFEPHALEILFSAILANSVEVKDYDKDLVSHVSFLRWYHEFLLEELKPTASYQRHITALKILQISRQFSVLTSPQTFSDDKNLVRLLLDLTADPFDDVRSISAVLVRQYLRLIPSNLDLPRVDGLTEISFGKDRLIASHLSQNCLLVALSRVEEMTYRTGRADYADAVGRTYDLMYDRCLIAEDSKLRCKGIVFILEHLLSALEHDIKIAQGNLRLATSTASLHGRLIALRYIVSRPDYASSTKGLFWDEQDWGIRWHNRLLDSCERTWEAVSSVLCFDSPEGHVLESHDEDGLDIGVKDTLSFSWRALKESSLLLHAILTNRVYRPHGREYGLGYEDFSRIGGLAFEQLAQLRHRGAFSTVSQTFAACCARCLEADDQSIQSLPKKWYQETLSCIQEKATALTRRSAGLPAMITGILTALPKGDFFDGVILDLQTIADAPTEIAIGVEEGRMPQVHALNCLKDVFTTTYLGPATEPYINVTLEISAGCLESNIWAIRNCGLMLLKSLLSRLIGGNNAYLASYDGGRGHFSKYVYDRNPNLPDLILRLLAWKDVDQRQLPDGISGTPLSATLRSFQTIFTAMEIIKRFGIPPSHEAVTVEVLTKQLSSPIWALRKKTAEALGSLVDEQAMIQGIYNCSQDECKQNERHGRLLCLKLMVLRKTTAEPDYYAALLPLLTTQFEQLVVSNLCPFTAAICLEIVFFILLALMKHNKTTVWHDSELFQKLKMKWQQTLEKPKAGESHGKNAANDLLIRALYLLLRSVRSDEDETHLNSMRASELLLDLMQRDHPALYLILSQEEELDLDPYVTEEYQKDLVFIARHASDPKTRTVAVKRVIVMLDSSVRGESLQNMRDCRSPLPDIADLLGSNVDEGPDYIPNMDTTDAMLRLRGITLAEEGRLVPLDEATWKQNLHIWISMMRLAGDEKSDISARTAAVSSLQNFQMVLRQRGSEPSSKQEFLGIYICLYDMLLDDDEDIRDQAALIVSWILSSPQFSDGQPATTSNRSLTPPAAKQSLLTFLYTSYSNSRDLYLEALQRLTFPMEPMEESSSPSLANPPYTSLNPSPNGASNLHISFHPVKSTLRHARKENTALFAEEKQNLYIDPVAESQYWADVLARLSPAASTPTLTTHLHDWVSSGLEILIQTAELEFDGPLGWSSKPAVFALGMQVILAAKLFVGRFGDGNKNSFNATDRDGGDGGGGGVRSEEICRLLRKLLEVGQRSELHGLWMRRIQEIMG